MTEATVILIGCTKSKRTTPAAARDLYDCSDLFRRRRAYAEASGFTWAVLSALHGVIDPDRVIEPYERTLTETRRLMGGNLWAWSSGCIRHAAALAGVSLRDGESFTIEVHAGRDYVAPIVEATTRYETFIDVIAPVEGLAIGQQKAWYSQPALDLVGGSP